MPQNTTTPTDNPSTSAPSAQLPRVRARRGAALSPLRLLLDLFSSVPLGIFILTLLFIYMAVGSAGVLYPLPGPGGIVWHHLMVRQLPMFELTEYEWFHTRTFIMLCALLTLNLTVTTLRKIPFNIMKLGVWTIHTGVIVMMVGCVLYFSQKLEGTTPIIRRAVNFTVDGVGGSIPALPGNAVTVNTPSGQWMVSVTQTDAQWPILSGEDKGNTTYAVSIVVDPPPAVIAELGTQRFMRTLLDGYPQLTQDLVFRANDPQPFQRVATLPEYGGRVTLDVDVTASLSPKPQDYFWLNHTSAIYVRGAQPEAAPSAAPVEPWQELPVKNVPRYNEYISEVDRIWPSPHAEHAINRPHLQLKPVRTGDDALGDIDIRVTGFLRYAQLREGYVRGGGELNPAFSLTEHTPDERQFRHELNAFDTMRNVIRGGEMAGLVGVAWAQEASDLNTIRNQMKSLLTVDVPANGRVPAAQLKISVTETPAIADHALISWDDVGDSGWQVRVLEVANQFRIAGQDDVLPIADIELRAPVGPSGEREVIRRWVFAQQGMTRDIIDFTAAPADAVAVPDARVRTTYAPASRSPVVFVAGPGVEQADAGGSLRVLSANPSWVIKEQAIKPGQRVQVTDMGAVSVDQLIERAALRVRPEIIPDGRNGNPWSPQVYASRRDQSADRARLFSLIEVELSDGTPEDQGGWSTKAWLPFHAYSFENAGEADWALGMYRPTRINLPTGQTVELMYAPERMPLPSAVMLDDFHLKTHVGGFTGSVQSIRDWVSEVRFVDDAANASQADGWSLDNIASGVDGQAARWADQKTVATNSPVAHGGLWFFQAFWDAPRGAGAGAPPSSGLNFTGLGVTNREGVYTMLIGSCMTVAGLIYAFYIKPIIQRRRVAKALANQKQANQQESKQNKAEGAAS